MTVTMEAMSDAMPTEPVELIVFSDYV